MSATHLSTVRSSAVEKLIRSAAAQRFGRGQAKPFFVDGQWHVSVEEMIGVPRGARLQRGEFVYTRDRLYVVVDAKHGIGGTGFNFKAIG